MTGPFFGGGGILPATTRPPAPVGARNEIYVSFTGSLDGHPMSKRLIILTGPFELPYFASYAHRVADGRCDVHLVTSLPALRAALDGAEQTTRILACCAGVVVPSDIIEKLSLTPYNIHPGSPDYPGVLPEYWAHADGATLFGATLHQMTAQIDAGPIIDARLFPVPEDDATPEILGSMAHANALELFQVTLPKLIDSDDDLPAKPGLAWTGPYRSKADYRKRFGALPTPNQPARKVG